MIVFRTQFPVSNENNYDNVVSTIQQWIKGSPHYKLKDYVDAINPSSESEEISHENESLNIWKIDYSNALMTGIEFKTCSDPNFDWSTFIVGRKTGTDFWVSCEVHCDGRHPGAEIPSIKVPRVINALVHNLPFGRDGRIETRDQAINLGDLDIDYAALIINGQANNVMPVVYISATNSDKYPINPTILAQRLAGLAHVLVEPNREFSYRLKIETRGMNAFGGAVGIYWPDGAGKEKIFRECEHNEFIDQIVNRIKDSLIVRRLKLENTWNYFINAKAQFQYNKLSKASSQDDTKLKSAFEEQRQIYDSLLRDADSEIERLKVELHKANSKYIPETGELLNPGPEQEFFPGEILEFIIEILEKTKTDMPSSRRNHIIESILEANNCRTTLEDNRERLKSVLSTYSRMDSRVRSELQSLGFEITEDGPHYKLKYMKDSRYVSALPKTPSDVRSGKNAAADIIRLVF